MTNQEFFDAYVAHLRRQGRKLTKGGCCYTATAPDGATLHCGIGGVMSEELRKMLIQRERNNHSIGALLKLEKSVADFFAGVNVYLLKDAQVLHDETAPDRWENGFVLLAKLYGLELKK